MFIMNGQALSGHLILIMAPSGSGKGMLLQHLRDTFGNTVHFAVSCTTREPRPNEIMGQVYHFVDREEFERLRARGDFLEWAEFSGNLYGTLKSEILQPLRKGKVVIREVELQGIRSMQELIPKERRTIVYVDAGPWDVLRKRIEARAPISEEHLRLRHERYKEESQWKAFADVIIKNEDGKLDDARAELEALVRGYLETKHAHFK
jgi:guanylate kinase